MSNTMSRKQFQIIADLIAKLIIEAEKIQNKKDDFIRSHFINIAIDNLYRTNDKFNEGTFEKFILKRIDEVLNGNITL